MPVSAYLFLTTFPIAAFGTGPVNFCIFISNPIPYCCLWDSPCYSLLQSLFLPMIQPLSVSAYSFLATFPIAAYGTAPVSLCIFVFFPHNLLLPLENPFHLLPSLLVLFVGQFLLVSKYLFLVPLPAAAYGTIPVILRSPTVTQRLHNISHNHCPSRPW